MTYKPVLVKWYDISTSSGWKEQEEIDTFVMDEKENLVFQVGFLYEEDERQICLLNSYFTGRDLLGDITKIPKGCVIDIIDLTSSQK
jgi:hypothetical protein